MIGTGLKETGELIDKIEVTKDPQREDNGETVENNMEQQNDKSVPVHLESVTALNTCSQVHNTCH